MYLYFTACRYHDGMESVKIRVMVRPEGLEPPT